MLGLRPPIIPLIRRSARPRRLKGAIPRLLLCVTLVLSLPGCTPREPQPGPDGMKPQDVVLTALRAANAGRYKVANKYVAPEHLDSIRQRYLDQGGIEMFWDFHTSARQVERFETQMVNPVSSTRVLVVVQKHRPGGRVGPPGAYHLTLGPLGWRISR